MRSEHAPDRMSESTARAAVDSGRAGVPLRRLWVGVLAAPTVWVLAELVGYYLAARSCEGVTGGVPLMGTNAPALSHLVLQLLAAVAAAVGLWIALGSWRRSSRDDERSAAAGRAHFMAFAGVVVSCLFLFGIVLFGFAGTVVRACSQAR